MCSHVQEAKQLATKDVLQQLVTLGLVNSETGEPSNRVSPPRLVLPGAPHGCSYERMGAAAPATCPHALTQSQGAQARSMHRRAPPSARGPLARAHLMATLQIATHAISLNVNPWCTPQHGSKDVSTYTAAITLLLRPCAGMQLPCSSTHALRTPESGASHPSPGVLFCRLESSHTAALTLLQVSLLRNETPSVHDSLGTGAVHACPDQSGRNRAQQAVW